MKNILSILLAFVCAAGFAQTHWIPNSAPYEDYMAMIVVVSVNGTEQASTSLEVGAFCGDECRGSALPAYFPPTQRYIYQLPVYGNNGDVITFQLYDHEQQAELTQYTAATLTINDEGYGSLGNPYVLAFTGEAPTGVPIELNPGWNWISYLLTTEQPLSFVLSGLTPHDGDIIKSQNTFATYDATLQVWNGSLNTFIPGKGYMYLNNCGQTKVFYYPSE